MGTSSKERAKLLRLRNQLILNECPYLVIEKMGGRYDDALSLLIEVVLDGRLPASLVPKKDWHGKAINGTVDENETSIATADIVAWMECISPNEQALAVELEAVNAAQRINTIEGAHVNFIFPNLPKLSLWDLACCLTNQNTADNIPSNLTRHKLAELVLAVYENKLWVEWPDGTDFDFLTGFINRARNRISYTAEDRKSLDAVTVRREDWETYSAPVAVALPSQPSSPESIAGWFDSDASMSASYWWEQPSIAAQDAASLLCGFNPNSQKEIDFKNDYSGNTRPIDYKKSLNAFEALEKVTPKNRTLKDWMKYAQERPMTIHTWLGAWIEASGVMRGALEVATKPPAPASRAVAHATEVPKFLDEVIDDGLTTRERQIRAIIVAAIGQDYNVLSVPKGGKKLLRDKCMTDNPGLFGGGPDPFNDSWTAASNSNPPRLRMADHNKYSRR